MNDLWEAMRGVIALFERMGLAYAVMGGIAVRVYGIPRPTYDVDFTLSISRDRLPALYRDLDSNGFTVPEPFASGWVDQVGGLPIVKMKLFLAGRVIDIDVFLAETHFQKSVIARRRTQQVNGITCQIVSAEDLILLKLIANRPRDILDVGDVLFMQGGLDVAYMRHWAGELGIMSRLETLLAEDGNG